MKSGSFNFLEPYGPLRTCNGIALPFTLSLHVKYLLYLSEFNENLSFSIDFRKKNFIHQTSWKSIRPVGAEWFHVDGQTHRQTDFTKLTVIFRNSAKAPKNPLFRIHSASPSSGSILNTARHTKALYTRSEFLTSALLKIHFLWDVMLCPMCSYFPTFRYIYCFTQKIKAVQSFAKPVSTEQTTRGHIPHSL